MTKNTILLAQGGAFANFIINSPLEQFEVTSLLGLNIPLLGYFNFTLTKENFRPSYTARSGLDVRRCRRQNNELAVKSVGILQRTRVDGGKRM